MINKSLRSIWRNKKSYFSGIFVLAIGLSMFMGMLSGYLVYMESVRLYHIETNFGHAFASVRQIPRVSVDRLTRIDGIADAEGTLKHAITARLDDVDDIINVLLIGVDQSRETTINQFTYTGEPLSDSNDIWLSSAFFDAHDLDVGDTIRLLISGRFENFTVQGTVLSPEYLFVPAMSGMPDERLNTVGFVSASAVEAAAGMHGVVNNISFILEETATFDDVELALTAALERYGVINVIPQHRHASYMTIEGQSLPLMMMGSQFPLMFLSIAVGMLYITLKRLITMERTEIGTMKAMGFSDRYIIGGYLLQGAIAAMFSFVLALGFGWVAGAAFYNLIAQFFDLAWLPFALDTTLIIVGFFIAIIVSLIGVLMGARSSMKIKPAEAMREAPPRAKSLGGKFNGFFSRLFLDTGGKLALRSMRRNLRRVIITVISISTIFVLMNTFFTMGQYISDMTDDMYSKMIVSDGVINLNGFESRSSLMRDIGQMPGVLEIETVLTISADLENNGATRTLAIRGVDTNANLYNIFDNSGSQIRPNGGIILSRFFADELGLTVGQHVSVDSLNFRTPAYVEVTQIIESLLGAGAYMEISELSMLFGSEVVANMVMINVEYGYLPILWGELADANNIASLSCNARAHAFARENADVNNGIFNIINFVAIIICFAIVYNISNIALGEKQREYATLRVLGFQSSAVAEINTFEYVFMLIIATIIGIIESYFFIPFIGNMFSFEQSIMAPRMALMPTLLAFLGCALAVAISCFLTGKQIRKFNLVDVLKEG